MRSIVFWLIIFVAGLLIGFVPQYLKARDLKRQVNVCNSAYQLAEARRYATLTYVSATQLNYGTAAQYANQFFDQVHQIEATNSDSSGRTMLTDVLSARDKIMNDLSKGNPQVVSELQPIVLEIEGASGK
jgi:type II secretory pathway pseudopilin PulG